MSVKLVMGGFVYSNTGSRWYISLDMGEQPPPSMRTFDSEGIVIEARARGSYSCQHSVGYGDKRVPCVLHGDLSGVAVDIFSEVDLDGGAVELHVGVPHPSGKLAISQGS